MGVEKMTLKLKTATSLVVSALLGSPTAEAFAPSFAIRELSMAATAIASHGMVQNIGSDRSSSSSSSSGSGSGSSTIGSMSGGSSSSMSGSVSGSTTISSSSTMSGSSIISSSSSSSSSMTGGNIISSSIIGDSATSSAMSGTRGALHVSRDGRKRSAPPSHRAPTTRPFGGTGTSSQPSMALSFRVDADMCIANTDAPGGSMGSHAEPLVPPEPGGVSISGEVDQLPELAPWACADDRPWRKRARHARKVAALGIEGYGWEAEEGVAVNVNEAEVNVGGGEGVVGGSVAGEGEGGRSLRGERRKRASEKTEVKASRKECASKALRRKAMPIMDLVGVTAPLFLIVGISIVQNGPGS